MSRYGLIAFASSLDQVGPFARTVRDAALLLSHLVGHDPLDSTSLDWPEPDRDPRGHRPAGLRVGVVDELMGEGVEPGVRDAVERALALAEELGALVERVSLPTTEHGVATYYLIAPAECSANLARFDGIRYGPRFEDAGDVLEQYERTRGDLFGPEVKRRIMLGTFALASGYYDAYYLRAQKVRTLIRRDFAAAFERVDLLLSPTSPDRGLPAGRARRRSAVDVPLRHLHHPGEPRRPAVAVDPLRPVGGAARGAAARGPAFAENRLLGAAHALEQAIAFDARPPGVL